MGNVTVVVDYRNSLGQAASSSSSSMTRLYSASDLNPTATPVQPSSRSGLSALDLVLIMGGVFVAAGAVVFAVVRKGRTSSSTRGDERLQVS